MRVEKRAALNFAMMLCLFVGVAGLLVSPIAFGLWGNGGGFLFLLNSAGFLLAATLLNKDLNKPESWRGSLEDGEKRV